ncbi:MAG: hypothetical protein ACE5HQ_10625 [Gemmatimonadota bacterium]
MIRLALWTVAVAAVLAAVDRVLLWMERKGWIHYRRRGLSRSGAAYHALLLESIFNPAAENIHEVKYAEEQEQDESGDPNRPRRAELSFQVDRTENGQVQSEPPEEQ